MAAGLALGSRQLVLSTASAATKVVAWRSFRARGSTGFPTTTSDTRSSTPWPPSPSPIEPTPLLEIGVLADDDNDYVIHAMPARPKYLKLIRPNRGKQL